MQLIALHAPLQIEAASGEPGRLPRFKMVAYTGGKLRLAGWRHPVIVDLAGLTIPSQSRPIRLDHDAARGIGHTDRIAIEGNTLVAAGVISRDTDAARDVAASGKNGFPWQASIGASVDTPAEFVPEKQFASVNGKTVAGPLFIARKATLSEISFVDLGADGDTSAAVAARRATMSTELEHETAATARTVRAFSASAAASELVESYAGKPRDVAAFAGHLIRSQADPDVAELAMTRWERTVDNAGIFVKGGGGGGGGRSYGPSANPRNTIAAAALAMVGKDEIAAKHFGEQSLHAAGRPAGWPELCSTALRAEGIDVPADRNEMIRAAFSTMSLPVALGTAIEKLSLETFTEASSNWRSLARIVDASDFKDGKAIRLSAAARFEEVGPTGEIKHGDILEDAHTFRVRTFARMFGVTRHAIINDDASILTDIPLVLGAEGARTVSDLFFETLVDDGGGHWTTENTLAAGSDLDVASLGEAVKMLRTQVDRDGRIIGFQPMTLVVPAALEMTARQLLNSITLMRDQSVDQQPVASPFTGLNLALVVEPRLDAASLTAWYLFSSSRYGGMLVAFLRGKQSPTVEQSEAPFNTLGTLFRGFLDVGTSLGEPKAAVKATGEAEGG